MNFAGNFRFIGSANIAPLRSLVARLTDEQWQNEVLRQQRYEVHRDTETVPLVHDYDFRHTNPTRHPMLQVFEPALRPILAMIAGFYESSPKGRELTARYGLGYFIRANLVRLAPGGDISEHRDRNFSLTHSHRVHVPVVTSEAVAFTVGSETLNLPEGEIFEINNRRLHAVRNAGDAARVHLVLDYVLKGEQCCCGERRHPDTTCSPRLCADTDTGKVPCHCLPEEADPAP
ncbi:aspartyl/asparaginyl beta-hydroxylase domain-containing protein [Lentisalinibacter sediminis]|uniref:aspartyl/asparaginyl beta-hydroxylase domain-containing protein n=1 Tax=Lentisalinibacter sediminis TaxID=2992237 RepID=UPI00386C0DBE